MNPIELKQPQRIVFGTGCMNKMCEEYLASGLKNLFILTADPILPLISPVIKQLEEGGVKTMVETKSSANLPSTTSSAYSRRRRNSVLTL